MVFEQEVAIHHVGLLSRESHHFARRNELATVHMLQGPVRKAISTVEDISPQLIVVHNLTVNKIVCIVDVQFMLKKVNQHPQVPKCSNPDEEVLEFHFSWLLDSGRE